MDYQKRDFSHVLKIDDLQQDMVKNHLNLYQGYVENFNKASELLEELDSASYEYAEVKRRLGFEFNGVMLHELYFEAMTPDAVELSEDSKLYKKITDDFGSYDSWKKDFMATGRMRGVGWVVLYYDQHRDRLYNTWIEQHHGGHFAYCPPILVMDVWEHAWMVGGLSRDEYMDIYFAALDWSVIGSRFNG